MTPKRKAIQDHIIKCLDKLDPSKKNSTRYKNRFDKMSDAEFSTFMNDLKSGEEVLYFYSANNVDQLTVEHVRDTAKDMGIKLFERIWMWDTVTQSYYLTPEEYLIIEAPIRRFSQFVDHKLSVPEGDNKIDLLTGQVTQDDKAGGISQVEIQVLYAQNMNSTILELLKYRGGDINALSEYKRELEETGRTTVSRNTGSVPRSAVTLAMYYSGLHLNLNTVDNI